MAAITGHDAGIAWLEKNIPSLTAAFVAAESARSGDLGYSYGTLVMAPATAKGSYYWLIVVEVMSPPVK